MFSLAVTAGAAALMIASGVLGLVLQRLLPERYTSDSSRDMIGGVVGLITLLLALVLGLLIWTATASSTRKRPSCSFSAKALELDLEFAQYGPDAKHGRELLRTDLVWAHEQFWGDEDTANAAYAASYANMDTMSNFLGDAASDDRGAEAIARRGAWRITDSIGETRLLMSLQLIDAISWPLMITVTAWSCLLFCGFWAALARQRDDPRRPRLRRAFAVASAIFLILELSQPYTSAAAHFARRARTGDRRPGQIEGAARRLTAHPGRDGLVDGPHPAPTPPGLQPARTGRIRMRLWKRRSQETSLSMDLERSAAPTEPAPSAWGPFGHAAFMAIWIASLVMNIGIAMFDTVLGLADDEPQRRSAGRVDGSGGGQPADVSVHPAGRRARGHHRFATLPRSSRNRDLRRDRDLRRLVSFSLASPAALLLTTFLLSAVVSLTAPAWLSITPLLVPRPELDGAIAANGVGYNVSRAVGPALGGFAIAGWESPRRSGFFGAATSESSRPCCGGARRARARKACRRSV